MKQEHQQDCPLCKTFSPFVYADYEKRKHFYCGGCGEFQISERAEKKLAEASIQWRQQYAEMAKKSNETSVLVIVVPSVPREPGVGYPSLEGKFIPRHQLPR